MIFKGFKGYPTTIKTWQLFVGKLTPWGCIEICGMGIGCVSKETGPLNEARDLFGTMFYLCLFVDLWLRADPQRFILSSEKSCPAQPLIALGASLQGCVDALSTCPQDSLRRTDPNEESKMLMFVNGNQLYHRVWGCSIHNTNTCKSTCIVGCERGLFMAQMSTFREPNPAWGCSWD
jgi:hypothetical protein